MSFLTISPSPSTQSTGSSSFRTLNRIRSIGSVFSRSSSPRPLSIIAETDSLADPNAPPGSNPTGTSVSTPMSPAEMPTIEIRHSSADPIDPLFPQTTCVHMNASTHSNGSDEHLLIPRPISSVGRQSPHSSASSSPTSHNSHLPSTSDSASSGQFIRSTSTSSPPSSPITSKNSSLHTIGKGFGRQKHSHPFNYTTPTRISISPPTPFSSPARSSSVDPTYKKRSSSMAPNPKRSFTTPLTKPSSRQRQRRRDPMVPSEYISFLDLSPFTDPVPSSLTDSTSFSSSGCSDSSDHDEHDRWISSSSSCSQDEGLLCTPPPESACVVVNGDDDLVKRRGSESDALDDATFFSVEVEKMLRRHEEVRATWALSGSVSSNAGVVCASIAEEKQQMKMKTTPMEGTETTVSPLRPRTSPPPRPPRRAPPPPPISVAHASPSPSYPLPLSSPSPPIPSDNPSQTHVTTPTTRVPHVSLPLSPTTPRTTPKSPVSATSTKSNFSTSSRASKALAMALSEEDDVKMSVRGSVYEPVEAVDDDEEDGLEGVEIRLASPFGRSLPLTEESVMENGVRILTSEFVFKSRSSPEDVRGEEEEGSDSEQFFSGSASSSGSDAEDGEGVVYVSTIPGVPLR